MYGILEILGNNGIYYLAVDFPELRGADTCRITVTGGMQALTPAAAR